MEDVRHHTIAEFAETTLKYNHGQSGFLRNHVTFNIMADHTYLLAFT